MSRKPGSSNGATAAGLPVARCPLPAAAEPARNRGVRRVLVALLDGPATSDELICRTGYQPSGFYQLRSLAERAGLIVASAQPDLIWRYDLTQGGRLVAEEIIRRRAEEGRTNAE